MTYRGFEIMLERQQCEFWTLNDDGDADEYDSDCCASDHDRICEYVAFDDKGKRIVGAANLDVLQAYLDKVVAEAEATV